MTNDQAIVIAASNLMGKTVQIEPVGSGVRLQIDSVDDALDIARRMMVTQTKHTQDMLNYQSEMFA